MILDTNALSAFAEGDGSLLARIEASPMLHLPVIVLGEFRFGIAASRYRRAYENWLREVLQDFTILPVLESTADEYAGICRELKAAGAPIPTNDIWIAALAREHKLPVISQDGHFDRVPGLRRIGW